MMVGDRTDGLEAVVNDQEPLLDEVPFDEVPLDEGSLAEDDEEAAFDILIEAMVTPEEAAIEADEAAARDRAPRNLGIGEFTCQSCRLIMARSLLADRDRMRCADCVPRLRGSGADGFHGRTQARPVPSRTAMVEKGG